MHLQPTTDGQPKKQTASNKRKQSCKSHTQLHNLVLHHTLHRTATCASYSQPAKRLPLQGPAHTNPTTHTTTVRRPSPQTTRSANTALPHIPTTKLTKQLTHSLHVLQACSTFVLFTHKPHAYATLADYLTAPHCPSIFEVLLALCPPLRILHTNLRRPYLQRYTSLVQDSDEGYTQSPHNSCSTYTSASNIEPNAHFQTSSINLLIRSNAAANSFFLLESLTPTKDNP